MADNKLYITQVQDNGTVMISEDVISTVVAHAIKEVDGVVDLNVRPVSDFAGKFSNKRIRRAKSIRITISDDNELTITCNINIGYNQSVVTVAKAVQDAITVAVESTTSVKVTAVNVNVCGIIRQ